MSTVTEFLKNPESVGVWTLDSDQSTITFNNKTMWGAMKVNGVFTDSSGRNLLTGEDVVSEIRWPKKNPMEVGSSDADLYIIWKFSPLGFYTPR